MQSITGHCAHAFDCQRWRQGCGQCPYLQTEPALAVDTTAQLLAHKRLIYAHSPLWIVTPSNWLKAKVTRSILGQHPVETIYNGVDTTIFKPLDRQAARHALGLPPDKLLVGAVANGGAIANPWKGGEYTEAVLDFLQEQHPEVCFVDVGGKADPKDPRRLSIPPINDESRMALAYNALDLFLYTPRADNCPLVVLEAMASGLPLASFATGGIPELVQDGLQGCLSKFQDIHGLVQAARYLLVHPEHRRAMGARARERALAHFDQASMADAYMRRYEAALSEYHNRKNSFDPIPLAEVPDIVRTEVLVQAHREVWKGAEFSQRHSGTKTDGRALPKISVITPSYNQATYLEACIRSVLEQDYPNIEYIIMDGGSTDGSREIISKYAHRLAYWQSRPDNGHYWAVQEGIRRSTGEIITWLNSDDQFHPHAFKVVASIFMQRPDIAWITGRPNNINADGTKFSQKSVLPVWSRQRFLDRQYHRPFIQQEGTFWRRSLWDQAGGKLRTELALAGDMELWTRFFRHTTLFSVDYNFAAYRTHGDNRALLHMDRYLAEAESVIDQELRLFREGRWPQLAPVPETINKKQIAVYLSDSGLHHGGTSIKAAPPKAALSIRLSPIVLSPAELTCPLSGKNCSERMGVDISLILPTNGRCQGLEDILESIPAAMGDRTYEIILYADREENARLKEIIGRHAIQKVFYDREVFGLHESFSWSKLMNHAFAQASGKWIMYASDDIVFYPHCFSLALASAESFVEPSVGGVAFLHRNTVETHQGVFQLFGCDSLNGDKHYINFGLIKAEAFRKTDGFDETLKFFWADVDICMQLWLKGYRIVPSHRSLVDHHNFLESRQQENRQSLFALDTVRFHEKWKASALFAGRNPLEKIRYFLRADQSSQIIESLLPARSETNRESKDKPLHIVVDGVIFQLQHKRPLGIARVWHNLLPELVRALPQAHFTILERRGFPVPFKDLSRHPVQPYALGDETVLNSDDDSLRRACLDLQADLFISTYFTRAPGVPNLLLIHDLIPEIMGHDLNMPEWRSKRRALETADGLAAVSQSTMNDLQEHYPHAVSRPLQIMHLGVDRPFGPVHESRVKELQSRYSLPEHYLLMVGNRRQYKNGEFMWACMRSDSWDKDLCVLAVGGENQLTAEERQLAQAGRVRFMPRLEDEELTAAYAGATAFVCLSRYEGFGLPVLEAMACGCPVITTQNGSLSEVAGDAALFVDAQNPSSLHEAIETVRRPPKREELVAKGYTQASRFSWQKAGAAMAALIDRIGNQPPVLVSAIVSTYNSERFIRGCLEDLLAQTIADRLEIIVIDSASTQDEGSVVKEFQRRNQRIKYVRTSRRESVCAAWNRGIELANGRFVTNANTDDRHRPDAYEKMVAVLEADPRTALVYADVIKTDKPNQTMAACTPTGVLRWFDWQRERLLTRGCFIGPQPMWRREVHDLFGFFDESMTVAGDYEFWLRISQLFDFRRISEPLGLYLERDDSVEHAHREEKRAEERMIHQRYTAAAAAGKIFGMAPLETLRRGAQEGRREIMRQAVADIERISQGAAEGAAAAVRALCTELAAALTQDTAVTEDRIERFIHQASHYFLTRGAAPPAESQRVNNDREADRTPRDRSHEGVPMMPFAEKFQQGVRCLMNSGHIESAQWMLDKWLADYPEHAPAHHERAMLAHHQGEANRAGIHFQKAAELASGNAIFQKSLGDFYHVALKNADAALTQYQKVLALSPDDLETLLIAGHLCTASHRFDQAQRYYQKVLRLDPNHADARRMLAQLATKQPAPQAQVSPEVLYQSACRQMEQGQAQEAARTLERVIALDPGNATAHNDLGVLAFESGDKVKAQHLYEKAIELAPYSGVFQKNLGDFYYLELGNAEKALARYVQALTLDPQDVESLMGTGYICRDLGRLEDARVFFERVLEIEPWQADAQRCLQQLDAAPVAAAGAAPNSDLYSVAQSQAVAGDRLGAIRTLEQLVGREPNHAKAYNDLGVLSYEQGDKGQALRFYEQAARLAPQDATFLKNLADFYFVEQGRTQEALRIYIRILESDREDVECLMAAGAICQSLGKGDDARTFFERVLEIEPWHAQARENLMRIQNETSAGYGGYIATLGQRRAGSA
jgi:glycosyltransferase involved in cell wall biosynthesis/Flp pilus assembly protein TadD